MERQATWCSGQTDLPGVYCNRLITPSKRAGSTVHNKQAEVWPHDRPKNATLGVGHSSKRESSDICYELFHSNSPYYERERPIFCAPAPKLSATRKQLDGLLACPISL
jgi:hypothetical protein